VIMATDLVLNLALPMPSGAALAATCDLPQCSLGLFWMKI
jgi:hypothetical protein